MKWVDIVRKLCSRKLWLSVAAFVSGLMIINGASPEFADKISGAILSGAAVLAYCVGEGLADNTSANDERSKNEKL